jgi:hypothetical protein
MDDYHYCQDSPLQEPNQSSATLSISSFGAFRATRYRRAMELYPRARSAELLPYRAALHKLPLVGGTILDAGGGNGYGSGGVHALFDHLILCDSSAEMMVNATADQKVVANLGCTSSVIGTERVNFLVSQAAYHHLYVLVRDSDVRQRTPSGQLDTRVDVAATRKLRETVWIDWLTALKPGGVGLVIDVPPPISPAFVPAAVSQFFDEVVHPRSLLPHDRHWIQPGEILPLLDQLGARVVFQGIYPASWRFPNREAAVFFVCELFSLTTNAHQLPMEMKRSVFLELSEAINDKLGFVQYKEQTWISWAMYAICFEKYR